MIEVEKLRVRNLSVEGLAIPPGITSVIGSNGSGKTTLLKACAGILLPDRGAISIDGAGPRSTEIGWVNEFPDRNFLFDTVSDEVSSPLRFRHLPGDEISRRTRETLGALGLARLSDRSVRELSGGEKVIIALAAAMVQKPRVIILDECDSHLDTGSTCQADRILRASGIPYIIKSTQDMDVAAASDYLVFLEKGRVGCAGTPKDVFCHLSQTPFYPLSWKCRA